MLEPSVFSINKIDQNDIYDNSNIEETIETVTEDTNDNNEEII